MACVGEKGRPGTHVCEMTTFPFETQFLLDATLLCYQTHQRFGLMGIELISDKDPAGLRIRLDSLGDMRGKVGFGARGSNAGSHKLSGRDIQVGDQALRAMPLVFEFLSL